jgi:hypothetical protein
MGPCRIDAQVGHAADIKEHAVANTCKAKEYVLANGAPSDDAGTLHVYVRFSKALSCPAVGTLSFCGSNVHCEYLAQFTGSRVAVEVVGGKGIHFRSPVEPKRSVLILSRSMPEALRRSVVLSTKDVGPQT